MPDRPLRLRRSARRCLVAEKVVAGSEFEILCQNSSNGCCERLTLAPLERHEDDCGFRSVPCLSGSCSERVKLVDLLQHLKVAHSVVQRQAVAVVNQPNRYTAGIQCPIKQSIAESRGAPFFLMEISGMQFALQLQSDAVGSYYVWVRMLASKEHAVRYKATIKVSHNGSHHSKNVPIYPVDMPNTAVMDHRDCFLLSRKHVEQCTVRSAVRPMPEGWLGIIALFFAIEKHIRSPVP